MSLEVLEGHASAGRPGLELVGVRTAQMCVIRSPAGSNATPSGDAVLLSYQTGLAVDRALRGGEIGQVARDLLAAFDGT
jgi:hypothetical protein